LFPHGFIPFGATRDIHSARGRGVGLGGWRTAWPRWQRPPAPGRCRREPGPDAPRRVSPPGHSGRVGLSPEAEEGRSGSQTVGSTRRGHSALVLLGSRATAKYRGAWRVGLKSSQVRNATSGARGGTRPARGRRTAPELGGREGEDRSGEAVVPTGAIGRAPSDWRRSSRATPGAAPGAGFASGRTPGVEAAVSS
jgi:hypothetical protein